MGYYIYNPSSFCLNWAIVTVAGNRVAMCKYWVSGLLLHTLRMPQVTDDLLRHKAINILEVGRMRILICTKENGELRYHVAEVLDDFFYSVTKS